MNIWSRMHSTKLGLLEWFTSSDVLPRAIIHIFLVFNSAWNKKNKNKKLDGTPKLIRVIRWTTIKLDIYWGRYFIIEIFLVHMWPGISFRKPSSTCVCTKQQPGLGLSQSGCERDVYPHIRASSGQIHDHVNSELLIYHLTEDGFYSSLTQAPPNLEGLE